MKKKILFVTGYMLVGGAEKFLIDLLSTLDHNKYEVYLQLFKHEGLFMELIPEEVVLLPPIEEFAYFDMPFFASIKKALVKGKWKIIFPRIGAGIINKLIKNPFRKEQKVWKFLKVAMPRSREFYDVAIGFMEKSPNYYVVDKVNATKKFGFVHNDYNQFQLDEKIDNFYFSFFRKIFTSSEECKNVLISNFPQFKDKFLVLHAPIPHDLIRKMADEELMIDIKQPSIVSLGRFSFQKGYDIAAKAFKILFDKGILFHWYIFGEGEYKIKIKELVEEYGFFEQVHFLGLSNNPYPITKACEVYLQTSRFEGKSVAIDVAKVLQKPILVTNFPTVKDQIEDGVTGIIADMTPESIAEKLIFLLSHPEVRQKLSSNLAHIQWNAQAELEKFYEIIES